MAVHPGIWPAPRDCGVINETTKDADPGHRRREAGLREGGGAGDSRAAGLLPPRRCLGGQSFQLPEAFWLPW